MKGGKKQIASVAAKIFIIIYTLLVVFAGAIDYAVPDKITITKDELQNASVNVDGINDSIKVDAKLFGKIPLKEIDVKIVPDTTLVPCGKVFGVKFFTRGVMIIKLSDIETKDGNISPAKKAGLKTGDVILSLDGKEINTVEEMAAVVENSKGKQMAILYERDGKTCAGVLESVLSLSDRKYKTGIWVRDSTAGIGTMTYYNPQNGCFAGLGHGICDIDTGGLMPLLRANVVDVTVNDIIKGKKGSPGELKGIFDNTKRGVLTGNTDKGVFGVMDEAPVNIENEMQICLMDELQKGKAYIMCQLDKNEPCMYEVEIQNIDKDDIEGKNFSIKVTDPSLIEKTGGIVQGMSGSPVIQNGKLIGAVTHVLINDPTRGYGIFIENMLKEAE